MDKFWDIKAKAPKICDMTLYGDIANAELWGDEVVPQKIADELKNFGDMDELNVYVNSGGGSVFAGMAIYSIIERCGAKKKVAHVDGLAASISSVIPQACDEVIMSMGAMMMVHNPWGMAMGNATEIRKTADTLDKVKESIIAVYKKRTNKTDEELSEMMNAETWMTAEDAVALGFADKVKKDMQIAAKYIGDDILMMEGVNHDLTKYKNFKKVDTNIEDCAIIDEESYREETQPVEIDLQEQDETFARIKNKILGGT